MPARKASDGPKLFAARRSFSAVLNGQTFMIQPGQVVDEGDPILKGREALFEDFAPKIRQYPGRVEQATAAPGEKRS